MSFHLRRHQEPIGVVLAGGAGARLGGDKALVHLAGRPLISHPLGTLRAVLREVAVLAKSDTALPDLEGITVWIEPEPARHPLIGLRHALALAEGRPVMVCPVDLPFITPALVRSLCQADPRGAPAVVASQAGAMQPLLGCYRPEAARLLAHAPRPDGPLRETVAALAPRLIETDDREALFNVNSPDDLLQASAMLESRAPENRLSRT